MAAPTESSPYCEGLRCELEKAQQVLAPLNARQICRAVALLKIVEEFSCLPEAISASLNEKQICKAIALLKIAEQFGYSPEEVNAALLTKKKNAQRHAVFYKKHKTELNQYRKEKMREVRECQLS